MTKNHEKNLHYSALCLFFVAGYEEIYVLEGVFEDEFGSYPTGTWMRSPHLSAHRPFSNTGCTILVKTGHLPVAESNEALA